MKILFVKHHCCNLDYLIKCIKYLNKNKLIDAKIVDLKDYLKINQSSYDILIYHTFPGEFSPEHFNPVSLIKKTDKKFHKFKKYKILFDSHDGGSVDGFSRFNNRHIPRIKNAPHKEFLKKYNVISTTTYPINILPVRYSVKNIDISFCVSLSSNLIRKKIIKKLRKYKKTKSKKLTEKRIMSKEKYRNHLEKVWISVCAPGWGEGTFRHLETLNAKSLMFAYENIKKIKLLPNSNLIEGKDYISFNLDNIKDKLDFLLENKNKIKNISENGYKKFLKGYSIEKAALKLYKKLIPISNS